MLPEEMPPSAVAGPSKPKPRPKAAPAPATAEVAAGYRGRNPQLGPEPWFVYPTPSDDDFEDELPPYYEGENVPLGPALKRLVRKGYGDMRLLLGETVVPTYSLPPLPARQKQRPVIEYAKETRQAVLKYLAVLRWKTAVDVPHLQRTTDTNPDPPIHGSSTRSRRNSTTNNNTNNGPIASSTQIPNGDFQTSFPTPLSNNDSPGEYIGKGKGRMADGSEHENVGIPRPTRMGLRGKVTDTKRIQQFMQHQNKQHEDAVAHVRHTAKVVEGLRERNPDLSTALSLLTNGTYDRLPTSLTEPFIPRPPLTNLTIIDTLQRLNAHIQYRLRCLEYIPPELSIERVADGRAYVRGGGGGGSKGRNGWRAELSLVSFGEDSRWWMTGLDWGWRVKEKGTDDPGGDGSNTQGDGGVGKKFSGEERQQILDIVNGEVLSPQEVTDDIKNDVPTGRNDEAAKPHGGSQRSLRGIDAPLVRLYNFIQHLSLSYQLEVLFSQAMDLSRGKWRSQLLVEIDRTKKVVQLKYWVRTRPTPPQQSSRRRDVAQPQNLAKQPLIGGTISIALAELTAPENVSDGILRSIALGQNTTQERILPLGLVVKWQVGEAGTCPGLRLGEVMDSSQLQLHIADLDISVILSLAARAHAALLTRQQTGAALTSSRSLLSGRASPLLIESDDPTSTRPLALHIPLPSRQRNASLIISVSALSGLVEIEDDGAQYSASAMTLAEHHGSNGAGYDDRGQRARMTTASVNEGRSRLLDDVGRLMAAIVMENLDAQMRQLGWNPIRRPPMRSAELAKNELHPAATIFVSLPTCPLHYLVAKLSPLGINFELLRLGRVTAESGIGVKLAIKERSPMDLAKLKARRKDEGGNVSLTSNKRGRDAVQSNLGKDNQESGFEVDNRDLKDLYIYCNALVATTIVEQQLKDRSIPFAQQFPPASGPGAPQSRSAVAGMVPTIVVNVKDLLKDDKVSDVAMPKLFIQIKDWWNGGKCQVVTVLQLRHRSSMPTPTSGASPGLNSASTSTAARAEGITFDQASSIVRFSATDISRCVPSFLEQWERLSKVLVVAGEVNRLQRDQNFDDLRMLSFDLRTATISYSPGFNASITYSPTSDAYEVTFFRSSSATSYNGGVANASTPAINPNSVPTPGSVSLAGGDAPASPHEIVAGLMSHRLNELVFGGAENTKGGIGREFISLLRNTLPVLLHIEALRSRTQTKDPLPALVVIAVDAYRLVWDHHEKRYAIDILLVQNDQYVLSDATLPRFDGLVDTSCGPLTPIPGFKGIVERCYEELKAAKFDRGFDQKIKEAKGPKARAKRISAVKLDGGSSLMCIVGVVAQVMERMSGEVEKALSVDDEHGVKLPVT